MEKYRKLIAAVVGLVLMLLNRHFGADLGIPAPELVDGIIAVGTLIFIERLPNAPAQTVVGGSGLSPGGIPMMLVCALLIMPLMGMSCDPLRGKASTEAPAIANARLAIDEANATLTAVNNVIGQNLDAKVWTKEQAQGYLSTSRQYRLQVVEVRKLLASNPLEAKGQADMLRVLVQALHREVAAQARKP